MTRNGIPIVLADKVVTEHGDFAAYYAVNLEENGEGNQQYSGNCFSDERVGSICRTDSGEMRWWQTENVVSH